MNSVRPLLHELAKPDPNDAVRRLAVVCLRHGSPQRDTIVLLAGIGEEDGWSSVVRQAAAKVADELGKKARAARYRRSADRATHGRRKGRCGGGACFEGALLQAGEGHQVADAAGDAIAVTG